MDELLHFQFLQKCIYQDDSHQIEKKYYYLNHTLRSSNITVPRDIRNKLKHRLELKNDVKPEAVRSGKRGLGALYTASGEGSRYARVNVILPYAWNTLFPFVHIAV